MKQILVVVFCVPCKGLGIVYFIIREQNEVKLF